MYSNCCDLHMGIKIERFFFFSRNIACMSSEKTRHSILHIRNKFQLTYVSVTLLYLGLYTDFFFCHHVILLKETLMWSFLLLLTFVLLCGAYTYLLGPDRGQRRCCPWASRGPRATRCVDQRRWRLRPRSGPSPSPMPSTARSMLSMSWASLRPKWWRMHAGMVSGTLLPPAVQVHHRCLEFGILCVCVWGGSPQTSSSFGLFWSQHEMVEKCHSTPPCSAVAFLQVVSCLESPLRQGLAQTALTIGTRSGATPRPL